MKKLLIGGYLLTVVALFLYSYTQVDLSLTLSRVSIWQTIEKSFQYVGYFQRPLSTGIFLTIVSLLFLFYGYFLWLAKSGKLKRQTFWVIVIVTTILLTFSYNAFSYDLFNYIFDAKIITHYHLNPYLHKALDFPKDPMLSFMQWTHRTYPYGPIWLVFTVPLSFIGFNIFLPTLFLFKILSSASFLGIVYFLEKILKKFGDKNLFNLILFALNPLVLVELLVSAHNDSVMLLLVISGVYFFLDKEWFWGILLVVLSALTKQATVFLVPISLIYAFQGYTRKKIISEKYFLLGSVVSMLIGYIFVATKVEIQPWYMLWFFPFFVLLRPNRYIVSLLIGYSLGMLLRYVGFLYQGDWNGYVPTLKLYVSILSPVLFFTVTLIFSALRLVASKKR